MPKSLIRVRPAGTLPWLGLAEPSQTDGSPAQALSNQCTGWCCIDRLSWHDLSGTGQVNYRLQFPFGGPSDGVHAKSGRQFFARVAPFCQKLPEPCETDEFLQALVQMNYLQLAFRSLRRDIQSNNRPQPGAV